MRQRTKRSRLAAFADRAASARGSTLIDALVAALVLTTGLAVMAHLVSIAMSTNATARSGTMAAILAEQKLEQLRGLTWGFDRGGLPISDTTTDTGVLPESPVGGTGLQPSPSTALQQNTPGFVDHVDVHGAIVGRLAQPPPGARYTRRWSVRPLPSSPDVLLIEVLVTPYRDRRNADGAAGRRLPGEAHLVTVKTRKTS